MGDERVLLLYICHIDNIDVSFVRLLCLGVPGKWVDERVLLLYICQIDNIDVSFGRLLCLRYRVSGG